MAGGGFVGGGLNRKQKKLKISSDDHHHQMVDSIFPSKSSRGLGAMLSFGAVGVKRSGSSFYQSFDQEDEYLDDYFDQPEKKRRLSVDQIQLLEKSFEAENKLEPERRIQLAKELGLKPRQIAVWFQNRRARWKSRQLETNYETLHASYTSLKNDYDNLVKENEKLKAEVVCLKHNGLSRANESANVQTHVNEELSQAVPKEVNAYVISEVFKNDEQGSAKSDLTNVDSPRLANLIDQSGDSSRVLECVWSDLSQNGEDDLNEDLVKTNYIFPKFDDAYCHPLGFLAEDHAFGFWSYN